MGGPARHVIWLTKELKENGFQTTLIAGTVPDGEEDMSYFAETHGVQPEYLREMSRELSPKDVVSLLKLVRMIGRERPDVIHTHTAKAGTLGRAAALLYKYATPGTLIGRPRPVRVIHTFHGHIFHSYYGAAKTRLFLAIERFLARAATDRIVVISPEQFREIHEEFHIGRREQFQVIPLGIDLETFRERPGAREQFRREIGAGDDETVIGFVGRLTEIKNVSLLLLTAAEYKRTAGEEVKLLFAVVGDGHMRAQLEREAADLGITDMIRFSGNRNDPEVFYPGLDIIALTSNNEGTPLSLIEGMAAGKPVIATGVGGVKDLLGDVAEQGDGFLVCERGIRIDEKTAANFTRGLIYLVKNEKLRAVFAERGRGHVRSRYSKERLVSDIKELYGRSSTAGQ